MNSITIRGIPERVYRELKRRAESQHRSLNREIILCLERSCVNEAFDPDDWLARADRLRTKIGHPGFTDARLRADKRRGRP